MAHWQLLNLNSPRIKQKIQKVPEIKRESKASWSKGESNPFPVLCVRVPGTGGGGTGQEQQVPCMGLAEAIPELG